MSERPPVAASRSSRRRAKLAAALAGLAAIAVAVTGSAVATEPCGAGSAARLTPCDLEVVGGEETWRSEEFFSLRWRDPPQDGEPPIAAVLFRVLNASMQVVQIEKRIERPAQLIERVSIPAAPGIYTAEVWLEDKSGNLGAPATAHMRFDNSRPGHVEPLPAPDWIGGQDFPYSIRIGHPAGPQPLSGIRGYAVVVDRDAGGEPCIAVDRCAAGEIVLQGGAEGDTLRLVSLPEGRSYVHAVAVSGSGMKSASTGHATLRVDTTDPITTLGGAPSGWTDRPVTLVATASDAASGMAPAEGTASPFTAIRLDGGAPVVAAGDSVQARVVAPGIHAVAFYARDAAGNVDDGHGANPAPATATVRIDSEPPRLTFAGAQDPLDPEKIEARVFDSLSGPSRHGQIALRRAGSGDRFEPLSTSVDGSRLRASWDSESYPPGEYEFRATGYDLAGNESSTLSRANGSRMVLAAPLKGSTELRVRLAGSRTLRLLPFGQGAELEGRLTGGRRFPLAGMAVQVVERFEPGSTPRERVSMLRTGGGGAFALRLAPGPSREVVASFAGTSTLGRSRSDAVRVGVRCTVRMRASATTATIGGRPVVFRGRALGEIPPSGVYVQLQFRLPGGRWTEFRTIRTDSRGRFRYAYPFSDDDSRGVRFQFRALAPAQDDWPYEPGSSRPVAVRGR